jgi:DNA-binding response OmpR family regulator
MGAPNRERIQLTLRKMARTHATAITLLEQTLSILQMSSELEESALGTTGTPDEKDILDSRPIVDHALLSIVYRGKSCFLGNTLPLKLFERLVRRPNQYLSYGQLLNEIWAGTRTHDAVRSVVKILRNKLRQAGMQDLAEAIDGSAAGHYGLILTGRL